MIKHIVMWTLHEKSDAKKVKHLLEDLKIKIPNIIELEVGIDFNQSDAAADVVLYSTFASLNDLNQYQEHPEHVAVIPQMQALTISRKVVDYEI
ncbi:MAG: Dabb family protein [Ghiorsea sp.]